MIKITLSSSPRRSSFSRVSRSVIINLKKKLLGVRTIQVVVALDKLGCIFVNSNKHETSAFFM